MARGKKKESALTPEEKLAQALVPDWEWPYKLPENWCWTKAGNMVTLHRGVSYKKDDAHTEKGENDCLIMRGGNISEGGIDTDADNVYVNIDLVSKEQLIKKHDIIIVSSTGSTKVIGRAGVSLMDYDDVAFGAFLTLLRPIDNVSKSFVDYYFQSDLYRERIRSLASGVNINNIRAEYITESPMPLPPLDEQLRIVDRIEYLFAKLDEAKEKAQSVLDSFETRKAAILHKAFTGELSAKWRADRGVVLGNWRQLTLSQCSSKIGDGLHGTPSFSDDGEYYFVNGNNFAGQHIEIKPETKRVSVAEYEKHKIHLFKDATVFVSINGTLGKTAFYNNEAVVLGKSACYVHVTDDLNKFFLRYYFETKEFIDYANTLATGSTIKNLGLKAMRNMPMSLPAVDEQIEIVRILDSLFAKEQQAREAAEAVLEKIDLLKKSILARAFRGELGTNDPSEESALVLLKNII